MLSNTRKYGAIVSLVLYFFASVTFSQNNFKPTDIPGLKLWLAADTGVTLNGASVAGWADLSGNNNDAIQNSNNFQPNYIPNDINNKPGIRFGKSGLTGEETFLTFPQIDLSVNNFTIIYFYKPLGVPNGLQYILGANGQGISTGGTIFPGILIYDGTNILQTNIPYSAAGIAVLNSNKIILNSLQTATNGNPVGAVSYNTLGTRPDNTPFYYYGKISEVIIYNSTLNDSLRNEVENYLYKKYAPPVNLGQDTVVCNLPITLNAKKDYFTNYSWQDNSTLDSLVVNSPGSYYVTTQNIFGIISTDTINVSVDVPDPFQLPDTITCGTPVIWNTGLSKNINTFSWQDNSTDSLFSITQSGTYYVTVTNSIGCTKTTNIANVIIDNFSAIADLGPQLSLCSGNSIYLTSGATPGLNYTWSDTTHNDSLQIIQPMGTYSYWVTVSDSNSCSKTDSIDVTVVGLAPTPDFSFNTTCLGNSTQFTDLSVSTDTSSITGWQWDFGDVSSGVNNTSILQNPTHNYSIAGSYTVRLIVHSSAGCEAPINKPITVHPKPIMNFTETNLCSNSNVQFTDMATTFGEPLVQWKWSFGDPSSGIINDSSSLQNPIHIYGNSGIYTVRVVVENTNGCADTSVNNVIVNSSPIPDFSYSLACSNSPITFHDLSTISGGIISGWFWKFNGTDVSSLQDPSYTFNNAGNDTVQLIVTSDQGCLDSITHFIVVHPLPNSNFTFSASSTLTPPFVVSFSNASAGATNYIWNFDDGNSSSVENPIHSYLSTGPFLVSLTVMDSLGCSDISMKTVEAGFIPANIQGLKLWLKADSGIVTNGSNVEQWKDFSGNNYNALQSTNSLQPLFVDSVLNNKPVIRFDGVDDQLIGPDINNINNSSFSIFIVSSGAPSFSESIEGVFSINNYTDGFWLTRRTYSPEQLMRAFNNGLNTLSTPINSFPNNGYNPKIIGYTKEINVQSKIFLNGQNAAFSNDLLLCSPFTNANYSIGNTGFGFLTLKGDIAEILVYNEVLNDSLRNMVEQYFRNKYAPPVNLGPDINISYGFCDTTIHAGTRFTNYSWNTGNFADTLEYLNVNKSGTYKVTVTDIFGFTSSDSIQINYPAPSYPIGSSNICLGNTKVWDTGFPKTGYTFLWQDSISTDSLFTITQAGLYYVKITDNLGCSRTSDTVTISIDNFSSIADLGTSPISLCSGNYIYLTSGAVPGLIYNWSDGTHHDSLQVINPIGTYSYSLNVTNANGCIKNDSIIVSIAGSAPIPDFSSTTTCLGNTTQFTDLSTPTGTSTITNWLWDFGDSGSGVNDTSTLQDPQHYYAIAGTYTVRLIVRTNAGCEAAVNRSIIVHQKPSITSLGVTNKCSNSNVQFNPLLTMLADPITDWNWNFGDASSGLNNTSLLQSPTHVYMIGGTSYNVQLIVQNTFGCADTSVNSVAIKSSPVADFNYSLACKDEPIQFTDITTYQGSTLASYIWNFGDGISSTSIQNPSHTFASNVGYQVIHVITDNFNCRDSIIKTIQVNPGPDAYFSIGNSCVNSATDFNDLSVISSGTITNWQWIFNGIDTLYSQNPQYLFNVPGNINVGLLVTSNLGCKDSLGQTFTVHPLPVADFTFTPPYGNPPLAVTFANTSSGASSYIWDFGDNSSISTVVNPLHTYSDTGSFEISLTAMDNYGCEQTRIKPISILKRLIDVAVLAIYDTLQNNFLTTSAQIVNLGTSDITSMDIYITVNNGPAIKENWTGTLPSSAIIPYRSNSSIYLNDATHFVCLRIENPNHLADENPANNQLCEALDLSSFQILDMYPNPSNELITLPLIIPGQNNLSITIYDANGKMVRSVYSGNIDKGLQLFTINVSELNSGFYGCRIEYGNETFVKKFIKK